MLRFMAVVFALIAGYSLHMVASGYGYFGIIVAAFAITVAIGLWFRKSWTQYILYIVSVLTALYAYQWFKLLGLFVVTGGWPYSSVLDGLAALVPGLGMVAFALCSSFAAFRGFRVRVSD